MYNHHDLFSPATPGRRLMAAIVDAVFVGIFGSLAKVLLQKIAGVESSFLVHLLVAIFYYAVPQHLSGQSIGKKIFDLKVVSIESESPPNLVKSILRETIGKWISIIVFAIGFLAILFSDDRRGWHDRIGGTKVISLTQESKSNIWQTLGIGFTVISLIFAAGFYYVFFTPAPFNQIAKTFEAFDVHLDGIHGSLYQGISIDKVEYKNKSQNLEMTQVKIKSHKHFQFLRLDEIEIKEISAETLSIKIMKPEKQTEQVKELAANTPAVNLPAQPNTVITNSASKKSKLFDSVLISQFKIKNISIDDQTRNFKSSGSEFTIENFSFANSKSAIESLFVEAPSFNVELRNLNFDFESLRYEATINGTLKTQLDKRILKNIDFAGVIAGQKLDLESVNLALFENKLRFYSSANKKYILSMTSFTPGDYLSSAIPFKQISSFVTLTSPMVLLGSLNLSGTMQFNNTNFRMTPNPRPGIPSLIAFSNRGDENFEILISNVTLSSILGIGTLPKMNLTASRAEKTQDSLARFYFGKNLANLSAEEQASLAKETPLFEVAKIETPLGVRVPASK